jgi:hypothetical protein
MADSPEIKAMRSSRGTRHNCQFSTKHWLASEISFIS